MKNIVLRYGLISGVVLAALTSITLPLCLNGTIEMRDSQVLGYSIMALSFIAVFFGVRNYRDRQNGGTITFGKAFKVGILIALMTCAVYVVSWEIVFWGFMPDFGDKYATLVLEKMTKDGAAPAAIAEARANMEQFKQLYRNPFFNVGMTFMEVFPVGLIVTLVSAAILRRRTPGAKLATA
jgi:hypothetical protein